jgi:preprotein translocase subunit SecF
MEFVKPGININFVGRKYMAMGLSTILIAVSLGYILVNGLNYGIDFSGGTVIELRFQEDVSIAKVRDSLAGKGLGNAEIKYFGSPREVLISTEATTAKLTGLQGEVEEALSAEFPSGSFSIERVEMVGPRVGEDLKRKGIWAIALSMVLLLIYISIRFEFKFAVGAIAALAHDVIITVGIYTMTGRKFTLPIVAAVLTIIGYSLNDTIVVFDRIREDLRKVSKKIFEEIVNMSINECLSRTILTSLTTLVVVLALFLYGGEIIRDFAFTLIVGVIAGTYSSIFVASPVIIFWKGKGGHLKK